MKLLIVLLAAIVVVFLGLVSAQVWWHFNYTCVKSHTEECTQYAQIYSGNVNGVPMYTYVPYEGTCTVCDRWEEKTK